MSLCKRELYTKGEGREGKEKERKEEREREGEREGKKGKERRVREKGKERDRLYKTSLKANSSLASS